MLKFTNHALQRLSERGYKGEITDRDKLLRLAREGFLAGRPVSAEEAAELIGGYVARRVGDFFYREDGHLPGVWVVLLEPVTRNEIVLTYLAPGDNLDQKEAEKLVFAVHLQDEEELTAAAAQENTSTSAAGGGESPAAAANFADKR